MITAWLRRGSVLVGAVAVLAGCAGRQPNLAQLGPDALFQQGSAAYTAGRYGRSVELLEHFVEQNPGDPRVPQARLTIGRAHLADGEYLSATADFQRLVTDFPSSPLAREARFGICDAYDRLSPDPELDQEYTRAAITHCESIAQYYPGTPEAQEATAKLAALRGKLARKLYQTGMFYFDRRAYDAAVVYFDDTVRLYADTSVAPAALLKIVESYTRIGYEEEATEARERLRREYPQSVEARGLDG